MKKEHGGVDIDRYVDIKAAAAFTGLSVRTLRDKINPNVTASHDLIPCYKPSNKLYFKLSELDLYMKRRRVA